METMLKEVQEWRQYCHSLRRAARLRTREVQIGDVPLGGDNPIRIQSMTTTDTLDTAGTVAQSIRMIEAGCEYVRITAPSIKEAQNLAVIKQELRKLGYQAPLVADIHFTPNAAELAARLVEKVRINPGNYVDKKKFDHIEYTDSEYQAELDRIRKRFTPLVKICKEYGTAMRIGTNHGSLSDRIMSRYGDTPEGMVESAWEFLTICEDNGYQQLVISMKASNAQVMVQAYRLLAAKMLAHGQVYPLHIGVTEAGEGEDGRIKSALGCGALLADGLGDTIRVSLTEPPEEEVPVARYIVNHYQREATEAAETAAIPEPPKVLDPFSFNRRHTRAVQNIGGEHVPRVVADLRHLPVKETDLAHIGHFYSPSLDKWSMSEMGADFVFAGTREVPFMLPNGTKAIYDHALWTLQGDHTHAYPWYATLDEFLLAPSHSNLVNFVGYRLGDEALVEKIADQPVVLVLTDEQDAIARWRYLLLDLIARGVQLPAIVHYQAQPDDTDKTQTAEAHLQLTASCQLAELLVDGLLDGVWLSANPALYPTDVLNRTAFGMLQAARMRITKTEYISCPSCGRTLFDLQETTAMIRQHTEHLKGVKIAIMGCIVNGPGEMADADYGYVGSGPGVITLYRGKEVVVPKVPSEQALDRLVELIQSDGRWLAS
jgi:(E)-4-hydroxy-3-methylbut-2-enyl-diphosphate synthase